MRVESRSARFIQLRSPAWGPLAVLVPPPSPSRAQGTAALSGTVTDPTSAYVSAIEATIRNVETAAVRTTAIDHAGRYQVFALPIENFTSTATTSREVQIALKMLW